MKKLNKKGQVFEQFGGLATGIAALAIILTVAFLIMSEGKDQAAAIGTDFCSGADNLAFNPSNGTCSNASHSQTNANLSFAWNGTATMQNATADIPGWIPLVIIAVIGAILLGLVALFRRR